MDVLHKPATKAGARQVIDVAFALPFDRPVRPEIAPVRVGLNISGLLIGGGHSDGSNDERL